MRIANADSHPDLYWHGFPRHVDRGEALDAICELRSIWRCQTGHDPGVLSRDLEELKKYFNPIASGGRLRRLLSELPGEHERPHTLGEPFVIEVGSGARLMTPEGRLLLTVLEQALDEKGADSVVLAPSAIDAADSLALAIYRALSQRRLRDVIDLQRGSAPPMLPGAVGAVLLLLLNRSIGPGRAMPKPRADADERLDRALTSVIAAFADELSPSKKSRDPKEYSFRGGYALSEATRRLPDLVHVDKVHAYVEEGAEQAILGRLAKEIMRRGPADVERLPRALDSMISAYGAARPVLASLGLAHAQAARATTLKRDLLKSVEREARETAVTERLG